MSWSMSRHSAPKARRTHRCDCCGIIIPKGFHYNRLDGVYDGEMVTTKQHPECEKAFNKATAIISEYLRPDDEVFLHDLGEFMREAELDYEAHLLEIKKKYRENL